MENPPPAPAPKVSKIEPPQYDKIPQELKDYDVWLNFSSDWDAKKHKWTKPPCDRNGNLLTGGFTNVTPYQKAMDAQTENPDKIKGVGFSFATAVTHNIVGIDFDHVVDADGKILPEVEGILSELDTYTEYSISGDGLHAFIEAEGLDTGSRGKVILNNAFGPGTGLEIFKSTGYMTVSGDRVGRYGTIVRKKGKTRLQKVLKKYIKAKVNASVRSITDASGDPMFKELKGFVESFEAKSGIKVVNSQERDDGSYMLSLERCPWGGGADGLGEHHDDGPNDAVIFFTPGRKPVFYCFHTTCADRRWDDLCSLYPEMPKGSYIDDYNSKFCIVSHGGNVYIARDEEGRTDDKYMTAKKPQIFFEERAWDNVTIPNPQGDDKVLNLARCWVNSRHARRYENGFVFKPEGDVGPDELNLWTGFAVEPDDKGTCALFYKHVFDNVCRGNQETFDWIMDWFADIFQNPGKPPVGTSIILKGEQGVGKGHVAEVFAQLLGSDKFVEIHSIKDLTGTFNAHMARACLISGAEITFRGDKVAHNWLKGEITTPHRLLHGKYKDAVTVPNISRFFITTNEAVALPAERTERRFLLLHVPTRKYDPDYFQNIWDQMEDGGYARLMYDMMHRQVKRKKLRRAPVTGELRDERRKSLTGLMRVMEEIIADACLPEEKDGWEAPTGWPEMTTGDTLYEEYKRLSIELGERRQNIVSKIGFGRDIRKLFQDMGYTLAPPTKSKQDRRLVLPPIDELRERWEKFAFHSE